jgi:hypothetical protein
MFAAEAEANQKDNQNERNRRIRTCPNPRNSLYLSLYYTPPYEVIQPKNLATDLKPEREIGGLISVD